MPFFLRRTVPVLVGLIALLACARSAAADGREPVVVDLRPTATDLDPASLRAAVARELGSPAVAPDDPAAASASLTIVVSEDRASGELEVARHGPTGTLARRVALSRDRAEVERAAVFLIGNLARDEAGEILAGLAPHRAPPTPAPAPPPTRAENPWDDLSPPPPPPPPERKRFWVGVSVEGDLMFLPGASNACMSSTEYACTSDSPAIATTLVPSDQNRIAGGLQAGNARFTLTLEYAVSDNVLAGVRAGFATATLPDEEHARPFGKLHVEVRGTYLFGDHPLIRPGFSVAPALLVSGGLAEHSASVSTTSFSAYYNQPFHADAWRIARPAFASVGFGLRLGSPTAALLLYPTKTTVAFGERTAFLLSPEIAMELGF